MSVTSENDNPEVTAEPETDEPFLARWSRRKADARLPGTQALDAEPEVPSALEQAQTTPEHEPTDEDMPPIDSLQSDSDFSGFMSPKVSEDLRRMALRKLFHLPQFNLTDGLNDYDENYTEFAPLGDIVTHEVRRLRELGEKLADMGGPDEDAQPRRPDVTREDAQSAESDRTDIDDQSAENDLSDEDAGGENITHSKPV